MSAPTKTDPAVIDRIAAALRRQGGNPRCSINDAVCNPKGPITRGWCSTHYCRWRAHGGDPRVDPRPSPETRFWAKVNKTDECWLWTASKTREGYGRFNAGRDNYVYAHRLAYEWARGPIPEGLVLDHLCMTRNCVNPDHLEPVDWLENVRRAVRIGHHPNAPRTCKRGHDWSVTPPYEHIGKSDGLIKRRCRTCQLDWERDRRAVIPKRVRASAGVCGTRSGYLAHLRRDELTCRPCRDAHNDYLSQRRRDRRQTERQVNAASARLGSAS